MKPALHMLFLAAAVPQLLLASPFTETTDVGNSKATAQLVNNWGNGETISGTISSSTDLDYYRVSAPLGVAGIYRHRVTLSMSAPAGRASTRGTGVASASDVNFISDRVNNDFLVWYSFGNGGEMYLRENRSGSGSNTYTMTQALTQITPYDIGTLDQGTHTLGTVYSGDTEIYLYDSSFSLIGQNDSQVSGNVQASMKYNFTTNGTYYIAIGTGNSSTYVGLNTTPQAYNSTDTNSPFYDSNFGSGARSVILDFQNVISRPENLSHTAAEYGLKIDGGSTINAGGTTAAQELAWFQIQVTPEPATLVLLVLGSLVTLRRPR